MCVYFVAVNIVHIFKSEKITPFLRQMKYFNNYIAINLDVLWIIETEPWLNGFTGAIKYY